MNMITVYSAVYCMCNTCMRPRQSKRYLNMSSQTTGCFILGLLLEITCTPSHTQQNLLRMVAEWRHTYVIQRVHFEISRVSCRLCLRVTYSNGGCWLNRGDGSVLDTWHEIMPHVEACEFIDSDTWVLGQNIAVLLSADQVGSLMNKDSALQ